MSGHIALGCFILFALIIAVDCAIGNYEAYRKQRDLRIRNRDINKFAMGAFKGTRDWRHL